MSLDWDTTECVEDVTGEEHWKVTEAIIWGTMAVDMGRITEANYKKFAKRIDMVQGLYGALYQVFEDGKVVDRPVTEEDIRRRIGLKTNVTTTSDAKFNKRMADALQRKGRA